MNGLYVSPVAKPWLELRPIPGSWIYRILQSGLDPEHEARHFP